MTPRLQDKAGICAYLGDISAATYDKWQIKGIVPGPIRGTNRYDLRAHDAALDRLSGIGASPAARAAPRDPVEEFESRYAH